MCDLQLRKVINFHPNFDLGVLRLYGKSIDSRFNPNSFGGQWVLELAGKGRSGGKVGCPGKAS